MYLVKVSEILWISVRLLVNVAAVDVKSAGDVFSDRFLAVFISLVNMSDTTWFSVKARDREMVLEAMSVRVCVSVKDLARSDTLLIRS